MSGRPDYSPAMLRLFLRARAVHALGGVRGPTRRAAALTRCKGELRRVSGGGRTCGAVEARP